MRKRTLSVFEIVLYSMLGTLMFALQVVMEFLPNIHLTGMFVVLYTAVFRKRALIPIYLYVFCLGIRWGFSLSWLPYLYIWLPLWGGAMLIPRAWKKRGICYPLLACLHGLCFGLLYAPAQAVLFGLGFRQTLAWIAAGFPWDVMHGIGNLVAGILVEPLSVLLERLLQKSGIKSLPKKNGNS